LSWRYGQADSGQQKQAESCGHKGLEKAVLLRSCRAQTVPGHLEICMMKNKAGWVALIVLAIASLLMIFFVMPNINGNKDKVTAAAPADGVAKQPDAKATDVKPADAGSADAKGARRQLAAKRQMPRRRQPGPAPNQPIRPLHGRCRASTCCASSRMAQL
jgi:hypothetical protein